MRLLLAALVLAALGDAESLSSVSSTEAGSSSLSSSSTSSTASASSASSSPPTTSGAASVFPVPSLVGGVIPLNTTASSSRTAGSTATATRRGPASSTSTSPGDLAQSNSGGNANPNNSNGTSTPAGYTNEHIEPPINVTQHFTSNWRTAHKKAAKYLADWTLDDKVKLVTGSGWMVDRCVGNTQPIAERNWKGLCLQDGPLGVRFADQVSAFPAAINAAATFDKQLMYERGRAMGYEFKNKGVNVALAPMTNMGRVAAGGRNWEGWGGDSYLSGWATAQTVKGLQKAGVQACVKHYIGNEVERVRHRSSSNIDDRTLHEVYLHPFLKAVMSGVSSVMCSYNMVNETNACRNSKTQNGILKGELGFGGYILSDWDAQIGGSGPAAAMGGLDQLMPGDIGMNGGKSTWFGTHLIDAINNGTLTLDRFNDMAQRIMAGWFLLGQDNPDYPAVNFNSWMPAGPNNSHVDVRRNHDRLIRKIGAASVVLLKNTNYALPLRQPKTIAVIGSDMGPSSKGPNGYNDRGGDEGTLAMGWGSGTANFPYLVTPLEAIALQARKDHSTLDWWLKDWELEGAGKMAANVEVAIVGINSDSGEEYITIDGNVGDRNNLTAWNNGDRLVKAVASKCNNTIVVVHSVGPMLVEDWIDHPNVTGVLWAGLPGQESGTSLVDVLYGEYNPSARLPYTIAKNRSDYSADIDYVPTNTKYTDVFYTEGLDIDYRHFLRHGIEPRFPFGFGLSYTTFTYSNIQVSPIQQVQQRWSDEEHDNEDPETGRSVKASLHRPKWQVTAEITNTGGDVNGCDVPQLYLAFPEGSGEPPRVLRDFERINLDPWETKTVSFNLSDYDLSIWDVVTQRWVIPDGEFVAIVARHSFDDDGVSTTFCPGKQH